MAKNETKKAKRVAGPKLPRESVKLIGEAGSKLVVVAAELKPVEGKPKSFRSAVVYRVGKKATRGMATFHETFEAARAAAATLVSEAKALGWTAVEKKPRGAAFTTLPSPKPAAPASPASTPSPRPVAAPARRSA